MASPGSDNPVCNEGKRAIVTNDWNQRVMVAVPPDRGVRMVPLGAVEPGTQQEFTLPENAGYVQVQPDDIHTTGIPSNARDRVRVRYACFDAV
jgi:hypothetical protein